MYLQPKLCPNSACSNHTNPVKNWFKKIGYYKSKHNHQSIPRYKCKTCNKSFSTSIEKDTYKQHKPEVNEELFKLLVSGVSLRRCSQILDIQYSTVIEKFDYLAGVCKKAHKKFLLTIQTSFVQVDEMETFLHARAKPLSVPMVVRVKTGEILGFAVAKMPTKLVAIKHCFKEDITFKCDSNTSYEKWITNQIINAKLEQIVAGKKKVKRDSEKEFDQST